MLYETIIPNHGSSLSKKNFKFKYFPTDWHYHAEYEILLITAGSGKRFVGNGVSDFKPGDVILIGSNLPHFHLSDKIYYEDNDLYCSSEALWFDKKIFPPNMLELPDFACINSLLEKSRNGILFTDDEVKLRILQILHDIDKENGIYRLAHLYTMLGILSETNSYVYLSIGDMANKGYLNIGNMPVTRAYQYLAKNFKFDVSLKEVAEYAGSNPTALCRSFKASTGKSIFSCLSEIRIEFASKLLSNSDMSVTQIAYDSGFRNISNFNHRFLEMTGLSPLEYRRIHKIR